MARKRIKSITLPIARCKEITDDFIAANSYFSAKDPTTINEVTKIVNGSTKGIIVGEKYQRNFRIIIVSKSFPANSAMYNQMVCNTNINIRMTKTPKKVFR